MTACRHEWAPRATALALVTTSVLLCIGCSSGVSFREIDDSTWFRRESRNALQSSRPSERTRHFLRTEELTEEYESAPFDLLVSLHKRLLKRRERCTAFHLAELTYREATRSPRLRDQAILYTSCVQYAYAYLFDAKLKPPVSSYDPTFRWTCDFYNRSLGKVITYIMKRANEPPPQGESTSLRMPMLVGELEASLGVNEWRWTPQEYDEFLVAFNYEVTGLPRSARSYGLGVPVIAQTSPWKDENQKRSTYLRQVHQTYAQTVLLRLKGSITDHFETGTPRRAHFEIYDPTRTREIHIQENQVPLEADLSAPLAFMLSRGEEVSGMRAMFHVAEQQHITGLTMLQPYQPDKIPVVFVHGLMSSPITWVPLLNALLSDRELRNVYQFWFFRYPTGNPILYSASFLRETLHEVQQFYDPDAKNPAFQNMVICGHSMGGLLTKAVVHTSEDRLWKILFDEPLAKLEIDEELKPVIERVFFFERLPFIKRVVFLAVPHRGSDLATGFFGRLGSRLINLPDQVVEGTQALRASVSETLRFRGTDPAREATTGISGLDPDNVLLQEMSNWDFPADLPVHSIIGNYLAADTPGGTDRVVPYESAHLEGVVSEKIVKSDHSLHRHPQAILEVRRILHQHLEALICTD